MENDLVLVVLRAVGVCFLKQTAADVMRISDWSSDERFSDLVESVRPELSYGARMATATYRSRGRPKPKSVRATKPTRVHKTSIPNWSAIPAHTPKIIPLR